MNLNEFCGDIISDVSVYANKKHSFKFEYKLKRNEFYLDAKLLRFMLANILSNAYKYSPEGGKVILTISETGGSLIFKIKDEGIGVPKEDREHLFKPFHRSKNSSNIPGSGLGLSIVKKAVELHNGEIQYTSKLKQGTIFTITLPKS
jgi:two-component system, OmpR family, sensor histidine kinase VicK